MDQPARHGVTLLELLIVIAIVSLLLLLLLPAVNAARELGRRTQCINNQRNLVVAMIDYQSAQGTFPTAAPLCDARSYNSLSRGAGVSCMGPNWANQIFGHIEEDQLYEKLVACIRHYWHAADDCSKAAGHVGRTTPSFMICPSAAVARKTHSSSHTQFQQLAKGNYVACLGSEHYRTAIEGTRLATHDDDDRFQVGILSVRPIPEFQRLTELTLKKSIPGDWRLGHGIGVASNKIKDGTSHTVVMSELLAWDGLPENGSYESPDIRGVWTSVSMGASTYTHKYGPNSPMADRVNGCDPSIPRNERMFCEQAAAQGLDAAETWASARSAHQGGVVATKADGSVHFYTDDIHLPIWQALATRAGGDR
jgi:prepilin-type N-terminal cleavage/methylation domain-containing protein